MGNGENEYASTDELPIQVMTEEFKEESMNQGFVSSGIGKRCLALMLCCLLVSACPATAKAAQGEDAQWKLVSQTGGVTQALLLEGDTLYLGNGLRVFVLDVSDPERIMVIGVSPILPQFIESITSDAKGHLFVSCGSGGLWIMDVSKPATPVILSNLDTGGYTEGSSLFGKYAVIADGPHGVQIADISNLKKPKWISEAYNLAYAYDVVIQDGTAYVAGGGSGLFTIDLSVPKAPKEMGLIPLDGFQYDVELLGGKLYAAGAWGDVSVLDISHSFQPVLTKTISTSGWAMALQAVGSNLLVMDGADGAKLYDLCAQQPLLRSTVTRGGFILAGAMENGKAFFLDKEYGMMAVDYADPSHPKLVSRWMPALDGRRVTFSGSACYVSGGLSGMHVFDLSDWNRPAETYWFDTSGGYANKVILDAGIAYLSSHLDAAEPLVVFDLANPLSPQKIGAVPNDEAVFNTAFRSMALGEGALYIAGEHAGACVDIRDPRHPRVVSRIDMTEPCNGAFCGNLFLTNGGSQLQIVDISDSQQMRLLSILPNQSSGDAVAFLDPTTALCSSGEGIWIVDISDPKSPQQIGELALSGSVMEAFIYGSAAYLSTLGNGVQIVDVSDPRNPALQEIVYTMGDACDCYVNDEMMLVADSVAGLTVYRRGEKKRDGKASGSVSSEPYALPLLLHEGESLYPIVKEDISSEPTEKHTYLVTSASDRGPGTLRECLEHLEPNTTVTFDPGMFPPSAPATIQLQSPLPEIVADYTTLDGSQAGVILDGSELSYGNGLTLSASRCSIMGLQVVRFPGNGMQISGNENQIGGSRSVGAGPVGQGNLASGNGICGIIIGGWDSLVIGNLVGTDVSGALPMPNYDGLFVTDWGFRITLGSINPDEGNVVSGNDFINMDTWGDHTLIIGNIIGLDISGTRPVREDTRSNLTLESGAMNTLVGGSEPQERNLIGGANLGVVFSDQNTYQNAVIGNYIGTDITGTKAAPNQTGVLVWMVGNNRVGGAAPGEGNLISGNGTGIELSGYGVTDNIVLGNRIGIDVGGEGLLPNGVGLSLHTGQRHAVIGGFTPEEGNLIVGGHISARITHPGIQDCYLAGNTMIGASVAGAYLEDRACSNFIQSNMLGAMEGYPVRVDYGTGNEIRSNSFTGEKPTEMVLLLEGGNRELGAPRVSGVQKQTLSGTTCAHGYVEIYLFQDNRAIPLGFACADAKGKFTFTSGQPLNGKQVILLVTDILNNTSAFSQPYTVKAK